MASGSRFYERRAILAVLVALGAWTAPGPTARADGPINVLCIAYSGPFGLDPNVRNLENNLRAAPGVNVTAIIGPSAGDAADLMAQSTFDQIYIWDADLFPPSVNQADKTALRNWWNASAAHRNIVLDGRTGGIFHDNDLTEQNFTKNLVHNLADRGGGLWIGAGYAPQAAQTANAYLTALAQDPNDVDLVLFAGSYSNLSSVVGSNNPLLSTPHAIDAAALGYSSLGEFGRSQAPNRAPGLGALTTVAVDAEGHRLITTNIPEPAGLLGLSAGAVGLLLRGRRRRPANVPSNQDDAAFRSPPCRRHRGVLATGAALLLTFVLGPLAPAHGGTNVLSIVYSGSVGLDPNVENLANNLAAAGATVTSVRGPFPGDLADLLQNNAFDQVYIWDLSIFAPDVNQADKTALSSWYANHANIVLDSRSGAIFRENEANEQALCANILENFANRGGVLWIGASYAPQGAQTAKRIAGGARSQRPDAGPVCRFI